MQKLHPEEGDLCLPASTSLICRYCVSHSHRRFLFLFLFLRICSRSRSRGLSRSLSLSLIIWSSVGFASELDLRCLFGCGPVAQAYARDSYSSLALGIIRFGRVTSNIHVSLAGAEIAVGSTTRLPPRLS